MGALARAFDWSTTPIGPVRDWPQSLRTAASMCLQSRFPMLVWWGPELIQIYNDGYRPVLGDKHPRSLGQCGRECWAEIWDVIGPLCDKVLETGTPTWSEDLRLIIERSGYREETYFTFSYSSIQDEIGGVGGVLVTCMETTERVLAERRMRTLRDIAAAPGGADDSYAACEAIAATLSTNPEDVPFALIYLVDQDRTAAYLAGAAGLQPGGPWSAESVPLEGREAEHGWRLAEILRSRRLRVAPVPPGSALQSALDSPVRQAVAIPFSTPGHDEPAGALIAGVNPGRVLNDVYQTFFRLIASQTATRIAAADAYEAERERAEKLAELDRAKTAFFSNVSHEFRTPLTLLLGPLEDALARPLDELPDDVRDALVGAHRNAVRLLKLVNTLLDFSRFEEGRRRGSFRPVDLADFTTSLASVFRSAMERAGLEYAVRADDLQEPVYVDPDMWEKIVLNLISNAFKYTIEGGVEVRQEKRGDDIVLEVSDTGTGIEPEEIPHLFERFYRAKASRARSQEGSGIGLALAKDLTELHGGTISVDSQPGEGSVFRVSLPARGRVPSGAPAAEAPIRGAPSRTAGAFAADALSWLDQPPAVLPAAPAGDDGKTSGRGRPEVLVVDDNADMRHYLRRLLEDRFSVRVAADGATALAAIRERRPRLVLSDVMMPGLDGFGLLRAIRAEPELRYLPVILVSARAGEEAGVEGLEAGADDYLVKPFSARELVARVQSHLSLAGAREDAQAAERLAREKAEEAAEARARFMANTSHELRTPLNAVMAYLELLLSGASGQLGEEQRSHLERIRDGAHHLKEIIEEILTFARLEEGTERGSIREGDVAEAVREVSALLRPLFQSKGLAFELDVPQRTRRVRTDVAKVRQILLNLLSNAHKYTEEGGVTVRMGQDPDGSIEVRVTDTGPGIDPEDRDRVFEAFWRGPGSDSGGGTGLGLNVARTLARLLGGDVTLESSVRGSTFLLTLPGERGAPEAGPFSGGAGLHAAKAGA